MYSHHWQAYTLLHKHSYNPEHLMITGTGADMGYSDMGWWLKDKKGKTGSVLRLGPKWKKKMDNLGIVFLGDLGI